MRNNLQLPLRLAAVLTVVAATVGRAQAPCVAGTISSYLVPGLSCTVGGLTFSGFSLVNSKKTPRFNHNKQVAGNDVIATGDHGLAADYLADDFQLAPTAPDGGSAGFVLSYSNDLVTTPGAGGFDGVGDQDGFVLGILLAFQVDAGIGGLLTGGSESVDHTTLMLYGTDPQAPSIVGANNSELDFADIDGNSGYWSESDQLGTFQDHSSSDIPLASPTSSLFGQVGTQIQFGTSGALYGVYDAGDATSLLSYTTAVTPEPATLLLMAPALLVLGLVRRRPAIVQRNSPSLN